ncbi:H-NS family nucleoid-associated regulatory protein [Cupriavidus basilensis]|uniref:H-NS histone family protein n=1 Tax=Cupriavidus basilensis TaxID=68895 RepID=A0A643FJZ0_9BURK|nr:H-NS histone family protein [Cupriavidus basilensis]
MSIEIERAQAITWVRIQMAQHGLTLADLQAAGCFIETPPTPSPGAVRYRNAQGWDGRGAMPEWLQRAIHAGQTVEHFRVPVARGHGARREGVFRFEIRRLARHASNS